ncbi:MAG: hypothetical protein PHC75_03890 [Burkholderiales bacterium]|nr:hypothetical protein [Burkholderiales bacterium]
MYKLAVIGNPIEHSLSPLIWQTFANDVGINLTYEKIFSEIDCFESLIKNLMADNYLALNVTSPFKARAFQIATTHGNHTLHSNTANLLIKKDNEIFADNTDGLGLIDDFRYQGVSLLNKKILILGNGSVIHSVLSSLLNEKPERVDLLMRDWNNLAQFEDASVLIHQYSKDISYDVIINTTPSLLQNSLFEQVKLVSNNAIAYDMIYTAKQTLFLAAMEKLNPNIKQTNGIGMLIQQAKVGFNKVFGIMPETQNLYPILQAKFNE